MSSTIDGANASRTHQEPAGKLAVVTGGGRGIGRGIVLELAASGWSIAVNFVRDAGSAEETCQQARDLGAPRALAFQANVSEIEDGARLVKEITGRFGRIDLWVNNAGIAPSVRRDLLETTPESWDQVLGTNLRGPFFLTQLAAREMLAQMEAGTVSDPQIIFVTSISANTTSINRGEYCVAKAGLSMVAQLFAARLAEHGIRVSEIRPGIIATDMTAGVREIYDRRIAEGLSPIRRWGTPEDVGKAVAALASGAFPFSTGEVFNVDGGLHLRRL